MDAFAYRFAEGTVFFIGAGLVALAVLIRWGPEVSWTRWAGNLTAVVGVVLAAFSAAPLGMDFSSLYPIGGVLFLSWFVIENWKSRLRSPLRIVARTALLLALLMAAAAEYPYYRPPAPPAGSYPMLCVIGDSISAEPSVRGEAPWPRVLAGRHGVEVMNLAEPGAKLADGQRQVERLGAGRALVLFEIGGNDMLDRAPAPEFERHLSGLLRRANAPGRQLVMMELPLPPFANSYGSIQRRLAREYDAILIPKRYFARLLARQGNTTDGLHLSTQGHREMAETIWKLLGGSLEVKSSTPTSALSSSGSHPSGTASRGDLPCCRG